MSDYKIGKQNSSSTETRSKLYKDKPLQLLNNNGAVRPRIGTINQSTNTGTRVNFPPSIMNQ